VFAAGFAANRRRPRRDLFFADAVGFAASGAGQLDFCVMGVWQFQIPIHFIAFDVLRCDAVSCVRRLRAEYRQVGKKLDGNRIKKSIFRETGGGRRITGA
jgi:hypothetical protein